MVDWLNGLKQAERLFDQKPLDEAAEWDGAGHVEPIASIIVPSLAANRGPTRTRLLSAASPILGAGSVALAVDTQNHPLTTDQCYTGFPRTENSNTIVDIGAVEGAAFFASTIAGADTANFTMTAGSFLFQDNMAVTHSGPSVDLIKGLSVTDVAIEANVSAANDGASGVRRFAFVCRWAPVADSRGSSSRRAALPEVPQELLPLHSSKPAGR
jgi:hypothetical protein